MRGWRSGLYCVETGERECERGWWEEKSGRGVRKVAMVGEWVVECKGDEVRSGCEGEEVRVGPRDGGDLHGKWLS